MIVTDIVLGVNLADAESFIAENPAWAEAHAISPAAHLRWNGWIPRKVTMTPDAASATRNRQGLDKLYEMMLYVHERFAKRGAFRQEANHD